MVTLTVGVLKMSVIIWAIVSLIYYIIFWTTGINICIFYTLGMLGTKVN